LLVAKAQSAGHLRLATTWDKASSCLSMKGPVIESPPAMGLLPVEGSGVMIGVLAPQLDMTSLYQSVCDNCSTYVANALVLNLSFGRIPKIQTVAWACVTLPF